MAQFLCCHCLTDVALVLEALTKKDVAMKIFVQIVDEPLNLFMGYSSLIFPHNSFQLTG
jgi:hypothetical protein